MTPAPHVIDLKSHDDSSREMIEVAFARTRREADDYLRMLRAASIAGAIESGSSHSRSGIAVLAEASELVRASDLLSSDAMMFDDDLNDDDDDEDDDELDDDNDDDYSDDDDDDDDDYSDDEDSLGEEEEEEEEDYEEDDDF